MSQPLLSKLIFDGASRLAALLPAWKEAPATEVLPAISFIPVALPRNHATLPPDFARAFVSGKSIPPQRVFSLHHVCVSGEAVVFRNFRIFIPSLPWLRALRNQRSGRLLLKQWFPAHTLHTRTLALVYDEWAATNYYHWMIEALPRLLLAQQMAPGCCVLLPDPAPPYVTRTLGLMGVNNMLPLRRTKFAVLGAGTLLLPERVYYEAASTPVAPPSGSQPAELIVSVRNRLVQHLPAPGTPHRRIYVSRSRQQTRRLTNEQEAMSVLEAAGFETVFFEEMDYDQQVALMQETAILAGVHGANMVNLMFLPKGAQLVELMNEHYVNDAYYLLAATFGIAYRVVPCAMAGALSANSDTVALNDADLVVHVPTLAATIAAAVADAASVLLHPATAGSQT